MKIFLLTALVFGIAMTFMAVGAIFRGRCFRLTCGGHKTVGPDGKTESCDKCAKQEEENDKP